MKKVQTYIGICDFMSREQVFEMLDFFNKYQDKEVQLMIGTMTSFKVINGQKSKWTNIFPPLTSLRSIFSSLHEKAVNCIHYADYDNNPGLADTLGTVAEYSGNALHAIQLDYGMARSSRAS